MRKLLYGIAGFFIGGVVGSFIGPVVGLIAAFIGIIIGVGMANARGGNSGSSLLCPSCSGIQLYNMSIREFIASEAFGGFEGKLALISHLKEKGGCSNCLSTAISHAKSFARSGGYDGDAVVDDFYRSI